MRYFIVMIGIFLTWLVLTFSEVHAMRPVHSMYDANTLSIGLSTRTEVRANWVSVLDVSRNDSAIATRVTPYLEELGYKIQRFDMVNKPERVFGNFDFIFYKPELGQEVQTTVGNLLIGLRDDGVLFVRANDKGDGIAAILAAQTLGYEIIKEDMLIVIKKKFHDQELFSVFVMEINEILTLGRSA